MKRYLLFFAICIFVSLASCKKDKTPTPSGEMIGNGATDSLKINQIQVLASHNSYHIKPSDSIISFLKRLLNLFPQMAQYDPAGIDYSHIPFDQQFNSYGIRGLEIDMFNDPLGGLFYTRYGARFVDGEVESHLPVLKEPGFKVLHIPDFDYETHYLTFKSSLRVVADWSAAHPNHIPIFVNIETKNDAPGNTVNLSGLAKSIPFDASACDKLDEEIKSVFGESLEKVITPDDVRGNYSTLEEAVLAGNWPQLASARGKVIFIMQGNAETPYKTGYPSLQGRAMFVYASPGKDEAAFVIMNEPIGKESLIQQRVSEGYIVRTRCDEPNDQAHTGDYTRMNAAFNSGAQILTTDYYKADDRAGTADWTDYHVKFPNGELARINAFSAVGKAELGVIKE